MRYALLICHDENAITGTDPTRVAGFSAVSRQLGDRLLGSTRLRPTSTATTVRVRDGGVVIADGPFAETKEQIAGVLIVECADRSEAIKVASQVPAAHYGTIEVRPVWESS
jgi:hypothetical protein